MHLVLVSLAACSGAQTSAPETEPATVATVVVEPATTDLDAGPDVDKVALMGILGVLADSDSGAGALWGDSIGDSFGVGGLGLIGTAEGGAVGMGSMGSVGTGLGGGGTGEGVAGLGTIGTRRPPSQVVTGEATLQGGLDKDIIRRVIRQSLSRVRYCYERALLKDPNLAGRVAVRFVIRPDGTVANVTDGGSTLPSEEVKACVHRTMAALTFPRPKGGGVVVVNYPFVFAPTAVADAGSHAADAATD
jgi:hypothetical protein